MALKTFSGLFSDVKDTDSYWVEKAKLDVALDIHKLMNENGISNAGLAEKLGVKPPYITKVLRGDTNLTIESMVKLARAVGGNVNLRISDRSCSVRWFEVFDRKEITARTSQLIRRSFVDQMPHVSNAKIYSQKVESANSDYNYEAQSIPA